MSHLFAPSVLYGVDAAAVEEKGRGRRTTAQIEKKAPSEDRGTISGGRRLPEGTRWHPCRDSLSLSRKIARARACLLRWHVLKKATATHTWWRWLTATNRSGHLSSCVRFPVVSSRVPEAACPSVFS
ncbi:hypothetical protein MRX96_039020 [Rhipicephalus microplus]